MNTPDRSHHIRAHYTPRITRETDHYTILDWASEDAQTARFTVLANLLRQRNPDTPSPPPRLLDIGCGMTDLATFLHDHAIVVDYTGLELVPEMAAAARLKFPDRHIVVADIVEHSPFPPGAFDYAFCSGVFNLETGDNDAYIQHALTNILAATSRCAIVNFLHERTQHKYSHCHYYAPAEILAVLTQFNVTTDLIDDYLENDFTVVIDKQPRP